MPGRSAAVRTRIHSATRASHGHRSASSRGWPAAIFAMFAAGCMSSPSARSQPSLPASNPATVDFPLPDTPMITRTGSGGVLWNVIANISSALSQVAAQVRPLWGGNALRPKVRRAARWFPTFRVGEASAGRVRALPSADPSAPCPPPRAHAQRAQHAPEGALLCYDQKRSDALSRQEVNRWRAGTLALIIDDFHR